MAATETSARQPVLVLGAELEDFRASLRGFLVRHSPDHTVRRAAELASGHDPDLWKAMCEELALPALTVPEEHGGAGFGPMDTVPVYEELGRALAVTPYFATAALAINLVVALGDDDAMATYLPALADGERTATVAWTGSTGALGVDDVTIDGDTLSGRKTFVIDGASADLLLVVAAEDSGLSVFAVEADAPGLRRTPLEVMDATRKQAAIELDATPAVRIGAPGAGTAALARMLDLAVVALSLEQVGGAQRCLELAVDYAKDRKQFGRPIGSFQAIKHLLADLMGEVETARALAYHAAWVAATDPDALPEAASAAKSLCSTAYSHVAGECIQVHGGIGFTWEAPCHLYFKRARSSEVLLGTPIEHRRRVVGFAK